MSENTIKVGDETFDLADIAGMSMDDIQEQAYGGFVPVPRGAYHMRCTAATIEKRNDTAAIQFVCEVLNCYDVVDPDENPEKTIGMKHYEGFAFFDKPADAIGRAKKFMHDAGAAPQSGATIQQSLDAFVGTEFNALIGHRKNKNDPDVVYANIRKVEAMQGGQANTPAPAPAAKAAFGPK